MVVICLYASLCWKNKVKVGGVSSWFFFLSVSLPSDSSLSPPFFLINNVLNNVIPN